MPALKIRRDDITPQLKRLQAMGRNTTPVMRAGGTTFQSITMGNFNSVGSQYRPTPWPPKAEGGPSNLYKSGTLARSFNTVASHNAATTTTFVPYARRHQYGDAGSIHKKGTSLKDIGGKRARSIIRTGIPPRPFFPVYANGELTPAASEKIGNAMNRAIQRIAAKG